MQPLLFPVTARQGMSYLRNFFLLCIGSYAIFSTIWSMSYTTWITSRTYFSFSHLFLKTEASIILLSNFKLFHGWREGRHRFWRVSKKLSNTKRKHGNGNLRSLRGEVAHTQGTCSNIMILNYGHSVDKTQVVRQPKKTQKQTKTNKQKNQNKTLSSGINWFPLTSIQYYCCILPHLPTPSFTVSNKHEVDCAWTHTKKSCSR